MKHVISHKLSQILQGSVAVLATTALLVGMLTVNVVRADPSCGLSKSGSAEVGKTISINVTASGDGPYGGFDGHVSVDESYFHVEKISSGSYGAANFSSNSDTFLDYGCNIPSGSTIAVITLKCLKEGSSTVSVSMNVSALDGYADYSTGASATIEIKAPVVLSGNANLSSLSVAPGTLSPSFSKDKTSYHVTVNESTTSIAVSATAEDSKASVSLNGVQKNLEKGDNTVKVTVTAENGDTRTYKILVTRGTPTPTPEPYPLIVTDGVSYTILEPNSLETIPAGFSWSQTTYNSRNVPCLLGPDGTLMMWLLSDSGNGLYRYDLATQTVSPCYYYQTEARLLMFMSFPADFVCPSGFEATTITYNEMQVNAYKNTAAENQPVLVYLLDEAGHEGVYYMDEATGMIIPFRGDITDLIATPTPTTTPSPTPSPTPTPGVTLSPTLTEAAKSENGEDTYKYATIVLAVISICSLIALTILLVLRTKDRRAELPEDEVVEDVDTEKEPESEVEESPEENESDHYYQFGDEEAPRRPGARRAGEDLDDKPAPDFPEFPEKKTSLKPVEKEAPVTVINVVEEGKKVEKLESGEKEEQAGEKPEENSADKSEESKNDSNDAEDASDEKPDEKPDDSSEE